jgi:MoaA/NifB/PqqE/SkfB family radical SAM enzyme
MTAPNIMELWLFDTCNFRCGYCSLVESGAVMKTEQLAPFRDKDYIDRLVRFFAENRPAGRAWMIQMTGGEPMLMPNLDRFCSALSDQGDSVAIYSNGSVPVRQAFSDRALKALSYIQLSFHPDWHIGTHSMNKFFENARAVRELGIPCLVRFVGAPTLLHLLPVLDEKCREAGVGFLPTTLFDPKYPKAYTLEERRYLASYMSGYSSLMQLDGGVLVGEGRTCVAADRVFAARLSQGGDITPCISTGAPVLGNIFNNTLVTIPGSKHCYKADKICSCDVHFQQELVDGISDLDDFNAILRGQSRKRADDYPGWLRENGIVTSDEHWVGQGTLAHEIKGLVIKTAKHEA